MSYLKLTTPDHMQGNHSDLLVQLSNVYSQLRGDTSGVKNEDSAQARNLSCLSIFGPPQTSSYSS